MYIEKANILDLFDKYVVSYIRKDDGFKTPDAMIVEKRNMKFTEDGRAEITIPVLEYELIESVIEKGKNMNKPVIQAVDVDEVKIYEIINTAGKESITEDFIVVLPEHYGYKPISFVDVGLINARPGAKCYTEPVCVTEIEMYGKLEKKLIKDKYDPKEFIKKIEENQI